MALSSSPTVLTTYTSTATNTTTFTTASFTPTANALLVVIAGTLDNASGIDLTGISCTHSGAGSWTEQAGAAHDDGSTRYEAIAIYTCKMGASPGSGTVSVTTNNNSQRTVISVLEVTGEDATPVGYTGTGGESGSSCGSTVSFNLSGTPASTSMVIGGVYCADDTTPNDIAPGTGFTEAVDQNSGGSSITGTLHVMYDSGSADNSLDWSSLPTGSRPRSAVGIEIKEAAASGVTVTPTPASAAGAVVAPTVVLGSITITPTQASAAGTVVDPTVVLGSITITPTPASGAGSTVDPTVLIGGTGDVTVTPAPASGAGSTVNPTVVLGSITLTPTPASAVGAVVAPTVVLGSITLTPTPATAKGATVNPTVVLGSIVITPAPASAAGVAIVGAVIGGVVIPFPLLIYVIPIENLVYEIEPENWTLIVAPEQNVLDAEE